METLAFIACGLTNSEAARMLNIKAETVKSHMRNIRGKLEAKTRAEAVTRAWMSGLLTTGLVNQTYALLEQSRMTFDKEQKRSQVGLWRRAMRVSHLTLLKQSKG